MKESNAPQRQDNTADYSNKPQNGGAIGNAPPRIGGDPPSPGEHNNPNRNSGQSPWWRLLEVGKFIGEIILIVVGICVARIYSNQLNQMIEQNKISERNARRERRPYVGIVEFKSQAVTAHGTLSVKAQNYGISPARGVFAHGVFKDNRDETWRDLTCGGQNETMNYKLAGPAIFQGHDRGIEIKVEPGPVKAYFAVCITFMDVQGPFNWFDNPADGPPCSPYSIKHLYKVTRKDDMLTFDETDISVEGAEPRLHLKSKSPCYNEE